jgi:amino-acid N-acetyltransferase
MGLVRKPKVTEVAAMKELLDRAVKEGKVLPRALPELYENVRDFHVYVDENGIGGCVALHVDMAELAEIRSLVVRETLRGRGVGEKLVNAVLQEARWLQIPRVYALTRVPGFFVKSGFFEVEKHELPYKVFKDCMRCRLFPGCDEIAMVRDLGREELQTLTASVALQAHLSEEHQR